MKYAVHKQFMRAVPSYNSLLSFKFERWYKNDKTHYGSYILYNVILPIPKIEQYVIKHRIGEMSVIQLIHNRTICKAQRMGHGQRINLKWIWMDILLLFGFPLNWIGHISSNMKNVLFLSNSFVCITLVYPVIKKYCKLGTSAIIHDWYYISWFGRNHPFRTVMGSYFYCPHYSHNRSVIFSFTRLKVAFKK